MDSMARFARVPVTGTILILAAAAMTMGCGVSKSKYMDVTKSRDELAAQNKELQGHLDTANKDKEQLTADKTALEGQVKQIQSTNDELTGQLNEAKASQADLKKTYDDMIGHLQGELSSGKVEIQQVRDGIRVNLAQDILFRSGSADLDTKGREILLKVAEDLKSSPFQVLVAGHTDNQKIGAALAARYPTNWELGGARAARIVRLYEEAGVPKERLAAISLADSQPREANDTPEGRAKNRRIEITLRPTAASEPTANK